ncbi:MAG: ATPase [Candidatus Marsarchaeota archaeon]|nr:ATPase [Candidatus Marsarchaeota archaeon]MCL5413314.1 ATPase [Candidatus Marsarchaeota archaeon]
MIIVGVNGGGTKTEAICCNENGEITGRSRAGPSNYHNLGLEAAMGNVKAAVSSATSGKPDIICVALAAMDAKKDLEAVRIRLLKEYDNLILEHDAFAELYAEERGKPGIIVIAGTGSVVLGFDGKERYRRCDSGWFLGDEGSGYFIGRQGLKAAAKSIFEDKKETTLSKAVVESLGLSDQEDIMEWSYSGKNTVAGVASVAKAVFAAAESGDITAKNIIYAASSNVANAASDLAGRLSIGKVHIKGGLVKSSIYYSNFSGMLKEKGIKCFKAKRHGAEGALLMAADNMGVRVKIR